MAVACKYVYTAYHEKDPTHSISQTRREQLSYASVYNYQHPGQVRGPAEGAQARPDTLFTALLCAATRPSPPARTYVGPRSATAPAPPSPAGPRPGSSRSPLGGGGSRGGRAGPRNCEGKGGRHSGDPPVGGRGRGAGGRGGPSDCEGKRVPRRGTLVAGGGRGAEGPGRGLRGEGGRGGDSPWGRRSAVSPAAGGGSPASSGARVTVPSLQTRI